MLQTNFADFPVINTERLLLRQIVPADAAAMLFMRSDETVMQYIDRPRAVTQEDALKFIDSMQEDILNGNSICWGISLNNSATLIGYIGYWRMQKEHFRSEIGYALHPGHQGKGLMQEAVQAVLHYGFETMKLHSVEANINPGNNASRNLLLKAGFVKEAYFRENYFYNGKFLDSEIYSLLKSDCSL